MLSESSEHVLRALRWIATRSPDLAVTADEIAERAEISRPYVSKILRRLTKSGILKARRGVGGGYTLGRPDDAIRLEEIVGPFERHHSGGFCVFGAGKTCGSDHPCALHDRWEQIRTGWLNLLHDTTLADLVHLRKPG